MKSDACYVTSCIRRLHPAPAFHRAFSGIHGSEGHREPRRHLRDNEADSGSPSHPQHFQDDRVASAGYLWMPEVRETLMGNVLHCMQMFWLDLLFKGLSFCKPQTHWPSNTSHKIKGRSDRAILWLPAIHIEYEPLYNNKWLSTNIKIFTFSMQVYLLFKKKQSYSFLIINFSTVPSVQCGHVCISSREQAPVRLHVAYSWGTSWRTSCHRLLHIWV